MKPLFVFLCLAFTAICYVGATKRIRHKENGTAIPIGTFVDGHVVEAEVIGVVDWSDEDDLEDYVKNEYVYSRLSFYYYDEHGDIIYKGKINEPDDLTVTGCDPRDKFTVLVHGWTQSCDKDVMKILAQKYKQYRGGCVTCFDYAPYAADPNYFRLVRHFRMLRDTLTEKLNIIASQGFAFEDSHAWGFSFGARLILKSLERVVGQYRSVDICDMAGPGFDNRIRNKCEHRAAAENVQCIYTSKNRGTRCTTGCHQNWLMGHCGDYQDAAGGFRTKSHGMCPIFYIASFEHPFYAVRTNQCLLTEPGDFPEFYRMGYMEHDKSVRGQLTAMTSKASPYNVPIANTPQNTKLTPIPENETIVELTEEEEWYGVTMSEGTYDTSTNRIDYDDNDYNIDDEEQELEEIQSKQQQ